MIMIYKFKKITRKANKKHVCNWCLNYIKPKEEYYQQSVFVDYQDLNCKTHKHCWDLYQEANIENMDSFERYDMFDFGNEEIERFKKEIITKKLVCNRNPDKNFQLQFVF